MTGKTKEMNKIKQVLIMHKNRVSNRRIAKVVGMNKETVNNYVKKAEALGASLDELIGLDEPELERRLVSGNAAYSDPRFDVLSEMLPYIEGELRRKGVTLQLLWEEYKATHPNGYGLTQFRFHYSQYAKAKGTRGLSTVLKDLHVAGEHLMVDFSGDKLSYVDIDTGEAVQVEVFVACLPATDYLYVLCIPSQRSEDFIFALASCLKALGGVPKILVPDNLKAAVTKTDAYEPEINTVLTDFANHYGCVVIPARPRKPKDKSSVERSVMMSYRRVYAPLRNQTFHSIADLNAAVGSLVKAYNQRRMQQSGYTREERFLSVEKPVLMPLPGKDFEIKSYASLKVGSNCCVYLGRDKHYYSVPHSLVGKQVKVIYTRTLVKVFCDGECVAVHQRNTRPGEYTIVKEHLASNSGAYRDRSPQYYESKAREVSDELAEVIKFMFLTSQVPPETFYRGCDGLLKLQRTTSPDLFRKACETALFYRQYRYGFIKSVIESGLSGVANPDGMVKSPPAGHANIRGKGQFS